MLLFGWVWFGLGLELWSVVGLFRDDWCVMGEIGGCEMCAVCCVLC